MNKNYRIKKFNTDNNKLMKLERYKSRNKYWVKIKIYNFFVCKTHCTFLHFFFQSLFCLVFSLWQFAHNVCKFKGSLLLGLLSI